MENKQEKPVASAGKKKSIATILIILGVIVIALIIAGVFGGHYLLNKLTRETAETTPSSSPQASPPGEEGRGGGGGNISPSPSATGPVAWPTDLPTNTIPVYSGGTVDNSGKTENPGSWSIHISGTTQAEFDAYKNLLISQGWTITNPNNFRANDYRLQKTGVGWDLTILLNSSGALITLMEQV